MKNRNNKIIYAFIFGILVTVLSALLYYLSALSKNEIIIAFSSILLSLPIGFCWIFFKPFMDSFHIFLVILFTSTFFVWSVLFYILTKCYTLWVKKRKSKYIIFAIILLLISILISIWGYIVIGTMRLM